MYPVLSRHSLLQNMTHKYLLCKQIHVSAILIAIIGLYRIK